MKIELSKAELTILNKAMGIVSDAEREGYLQPWITDLVESDEFNELNEKIAEKLADA